MTNNEIMIKMENDIRLRGLSSQTLEEYIGRARFFLRYIGNKSLEDCDEKDIRNFLMYLMNERKLSSSTVNVYNCSLRFLFGFTMERNLNYRMIPRMKIVRRLPNIMTREQIEILFDACNNLRDKAILMTIYGGGLRLSEVCNLKGEDIYASSMRIKIRQGKGGKDRFTLLSQRNLNILTQYYIQYQPHHPEGFLFLTKSGNPVKWRTVQDIFKRARNRAGLSDSFTVHTLRHNFATHLLQAGTDVCQIKKLLGHTHIQSTTFYLHLLEFDDSLVSPLDSLSPSPKKRGRPKGSKNKRTAGGESHA